MATRAEKLKAQEEKKGTSEKRATKLAQRKPTKTNRLEPKTSARSTRNKRDTMLVIAHEVAASTPEARAERAKYE